MTVYLVGAGPGDPRLITVRGADLLRAADVVLHDRLVDRRLVSLAPLTAEVIDVGKRAGASGTQTLINELLVHLGRTRETIVRLKGGDPFVFGRGGEEAEALAEAGIDYEVVPGITSAVAAPAAAGVPVTHRGSASAFTVVTGHSRDGAEDEVEWEALARVGGTLVILMGVGNRAFIARRLLDGGLAADTRVAAVADGTTASQRVFRTTLAELGDAEIAAPATIVIGAVAALNLVSSMPSKDTLLQSVIAGEAIR